ncbi:MAG: glycosyltransferase family A protein [Gemmatimonadaceae bacterium]
MLGTESKNGEPFTVPASLVTQPQATVIITTYNYARFVGEAVASVVAQTFDDIQILVIDDGSTDDTPAVLAAIDDPRLEVVRTLNQGIGASRNEGLSRVKGEFVAFLDADDRWLPDKLQRQVAVMRSEPGVVACFTNFVRFNDQGVFPVDQFTFFPELQQIPTQPTRDGGGFRLTGNAFSTLVAFQEIPAWVQTILFRSSAVRDLRFPIDPQNDPSVRYGVCEDMHFCLRSYRAGSVAFLADPLVEVRRHGKNATSQRSDMAQAKLAAFRLLAHESLGPAERLALRYRLGRALIESGVQYAGDGHPAKAAASFREALSFNGARLSALKNLALLTVSKSPTASSS